MKHSNYLWDEFSAFTKAHCLAFSGRACVNTVTDKLHPINFGDFFVSTTTLINQRYLLLSLNCLKYLWSYAQLVLCGDKNKLLLHSSVTWTYHWRHTRHPQCQHSVPISLVSVACHCLSLPYNSIGCYHHYLKTWQCGELFTLARRHQHTDSWVTGLP